MQEVHLRHGVQEVHLRHGVQEVHLRHGVQEVHLRCAQLPGLTSHSYTHYAQKCTRIYYFESREFEFFSGRGLNPSHTRPLRQISKWHRAYEYTSAMKMMAMPMLNYSTELYAEGCQTFRILSFSYPALRTRCFLRDLGLGTSGRVRVSVGIRC